MANPAAPAALGVKKAKQPTKPAEHPTYATMIAGAIQGLGDKKGSSRQAILKHVVANNKVDAAKAARLVRQTLAKMIASKKVITAAAAGKKGAGSFKLGVELKKPQAAKKPAAKKSGKVKKKPAAKKSVKKAAKKVAKKTAAKKPASKKPASKKTGKLAAKKTASQRVTVRK